ncbi:MAG: site-specific DNA-methyltransferase [Bacteroidota bacterium]
MTTYTIHSNDAAGWTGDGAHIDPLGPFVPLDVRSRIEDKGQRAIPGIAKDPHLTQKIEAQARALPTEHRLLLGDARGPLPVPDESVHLVVTSPPYWTLKEYAPNDRQLGEVEEYDTFLDELDRVWQEAYRVLAPGGRLVVVVGDVCLSRRRYGRHVVFPLHASIQERCRFIGFDNLAPIIWHKIANASLEAAGNGSSFLGKPYEPNAVVKNDIEYILFQRKPGGYRSPTESMRALSVIPEAEHREWFRQIWTINGASTREHPAPYPLSLAERLVRMFSFVGDTVLDPFSGTATTSLAAGLWGRHSIGVEVEPSYMKLALTRLARELPDPLPLFAEVAGP